MDHTTTLRILATHLSPSTVITNTYWVHLDLGTYVKGVIEYTTKNKHLYATSYGVLSRKR
ncbi:hypothetical protein GGI35DRAFT_451351 [Trichoderma velutinum]